jgi:type VI secretion system protein ImpL
VFFADGRTRPRILLDITPVSADAGTKQVVLDLDGVPIVYPSGAHSSTQVTWPTFNSQPVMRLVFDPPLPGTGRAGAMQAGAMQAGALQAGALQAGALQESGPWGLFRLINHGRLQPQAGTPGRYTLTFAAGDRQAVFDVRTNATSDPFTPGMLQDFRCPSVRAN